MTSALFIRDPAVIGLEVVVRRLCTPDDQTEQVVLVRTDLAGSVVQAGFATNATVTSLIVGQSRASRLRGFEASGRRGMGL